MSELAFLSPAQCGAEVRLVSPLRRVLADVDPAVIRDLSRLGKLEVRGDLTALQTTHDVLRYGADRALVTCEPDETVATIAAVEEQGHTVFDATGAFAGLEIHGLTLFRRLSRLNPDALPAAGSFARTRGIVSRPHDDTFRIFVPQEHGHFVCEFVLDAIAGLDGGEH